ncbi:MULTISPECIES: acyl carrier protein [Polymorphospora]|uniref:Acyl carrier protein n=1 Tax=Polymorphospora lycopeni TaxID=3140240 RepID=A0ABV5CRF9_9ACTN
MPEPATTESLTDIVAAVLGVDPTDVHDRSGPATLSGWTSLKHVELVVRLEQSYQVRFSHQEIVAFTTVEAVREALRLKGVAV